MFEWYSVKMVKDDDECYTMQEARSELGACNLTQMKWRDGWRAVEAKRFPVFYQELDVGTEEEQAALAEQRRLTLIKANSKTIVTPLGEFSSISDAVKKYGTRKRLMKLIAKNPTEYYYKK